MATDQNFVDDICGRVAGAGAISARKMFGEYGLYCDGKIVGLICDNQLFLKNLPGAAALLGDVTLAPPYPGAKDHILVDDGLDDSDLLVRVIGALAAELPPPKPKAKPKPRK